MSGVQVTCTPAEIRELIDARIRTIGYRAEAVQKYSKSSGGREATLRDIAEVVAAIQHDLRRAQELVETLKEPDGR